jgi:hypothetical protein
MKNREKAFPVMYPQSQSGMCLRDYFAGIVLKSLANDPRVARSDIPQIAYNLADAMMAERGKE